MPKEAFTLNHITRRKMVVIILKFFCGQMAKPSA